MDPLSISASASGIAVLCLKIAGTITTWVEKTKCANDDVQAFVDEVRTLSRTLSVVGHHIVRPAVSTALQSQTAGSEICTNIHDSLEKCNATLEELRVLFSTMQTRSSNPLTQLSKAIWLNRKSDTIVRLRRQVQFYKDSMQLALQMLLIMDNHAGYAGLQSRIDLVLQGVQQNAEQTRTLWLVSSPSGPIRDAHGRPEQYALTPTNTVAVLEPRQCEVVTARQSALTESVRESELESHGSVVDANALPSTIDSFMDGSIERELETYDTLARFLDCARSVVTTSNASDGSSIISQASVSDATLDIVDEWVWRQDGLSIQAWARLEARIPRSQPVLGRYKKKHGYTAQNLNDLCDEVDELGKLKDLRPAAAALLGSFFNEWDRAKWSADQAHRSDYDRELKTLIEIIQDPQQPSELGSGTKSVGLSGCALANFLVFLDRLEFLAIVIERDGVTIAQEGSWPSPIHVAASLGRHQMLLFLLGQGFDVDIPDQHGMTPLMAACQAGQRVASEILVSHTANILTQSRETGKTALQLAISTQMIDTANLIIALTPQEKLDERDHEKCTALNQACLQGENLFPVIEFLLRKGANSEIRSSDGRSAITIASGRNDTGLLQLIFDCDETLTSTVGIAEALIVSCEKNNLNVLRFAISHSTFDRVDMNTRITAVRTGCEEGGAETLRVLLDLDAPLLDEIRSSRQTRSRKKDRGRSTNVLFLACRAGNFDALKLFLIDYGFEIDSAKIPLDHKLIAEAFRNRNADAIRLLIEQDKRHFVLNVMEDGSTTLHLACQVGISRDTFQWLLDATSEKTSVNDQGYTPLGTAILHGRVEMIELLIQNGICRLSNPGEETMLLSALLEQRKADILALLWYRNIRLTNEPLLPLAVHTDDPDVISFALSQNTTSYRFNDDSLPLDTALSQERVPILERFAKAEDNGKLYLLHRAVFKGSIAGVEVFLAGGLDVNAVEPERNRSPLHLAVEQGNLKIAKMLIEHGADVNMPDSEERTPLHIAAAQKQMDIVYLLLSYKADRTALDKRGDDARILAIRAGIAVDTKADYDLDSHRCICCTRFAVQEVLCGWT